MQRTGRILMFFGLILGVLAAVATMVALNARSPETAAPVKTKKVLVAQQAIPMHGRIEAAAITVAEWPEDAVRPEALTDPSSAVGKLAATPIVPGQLIVKGMVIDKTGPEGGAQATGTGSTASILIPEGKVAVAFPIDALTGVAAALKEGDHVDVIVSYELSSSTTGVRRHVTQLALQDVEIMRLGLWTSANSDAAAKEAAQITLAVTPQDALVLKFLRETSSDVQLALRPAGNHEVFKTQPVVIEYVDQRFSFGGLLSNLR